MKRILAVLLLLWLAVPAHAAQVSNFVCTSLAIPATCGDFNSLVAAVNAIVTAQQPNVSGSVNAIQLLPAITGGVTTIGVQTGGDTNAAIGIKPNGNGDIVLFYGSAATSTGLLNFGNQFSWYPATGLDKCPGAAPRSLSGFGLGPGTAVTGFFGAQDWLGRTRYMVVCG